MATVKISALTAAGAAPADDDVFPGVQDSSSATKKWTIAEISEKMQSDIDAAVISSSKYTNNNNTASVITFSDTSDFAVGEATKIVCDDVATPRYGIITAISANTSITLSGYPLATNPNVISSIARLAPARVIQMDIFLPGLYAVDGTTTGLIARETRSLLRWQMPPAYLVYAAARHATADSDSSNQPHLNFTIGGTDAFSTDITMPNSTAWTPVAAGDADGSNYQLVFGSAIEIDLTTAAGNLDCRDLTVSLAMVLD